tara:strand:- start:171 stop:1094 length:924 start_codon:yes stop_codon:yes gene_type:complete
MLVELVKVQTTDGVRLDGAWNKAATLNSNQDSSGKESKSLVLCLHGVGSNFYGSRMMSEVAEAVADWGYDCLRVNLRGHDYCYTGMSRMGIRRLGSAYERVEQCLEDLDAWLVWADERYQRVILLGHSLGAIKALYYQVHRSPQSLQALPSLRQVIAISPPRLSYKAFSQGQQSAEFRQSIQNARDAMEAGAPQQLVDVTVPFPLLMTAESYLDKYGPQEKYNIEQLLDGIQLQTDFIYGGHELQFGGVAFAGLDESIPELVRRMEVASQVTLQVVPEADHLYSQHTTDLLLKLQPLLADGTSTDCS